MTRRPPPGPARPGPAPSGQTHWDILTGSPERDRRNLALLMEAVEELYGSRDLEELIRHAVDRAIHVTGAQRGLLLLEEGDGLAVRVARGAAGADLPLDTRFSGSVVRKVQETQEPHLTVGAEDEARANLGQSILDLRLLSIMAVPLAVQGRPLGILYVDSTVRVKEFTRTDFQVFQALARIVALAVEGGRLLAERAERERLSREVAVARDIQQRLFPAHGLGALPGWDLAGTCRPCEETSGDYYDVVALRDGRVALVMGDVSGHGLGPALWMASTRALLHALLEATGDLPTVLRTLNRFLVRDMPDNAFLSLFVGLLDRRAGSLVYVNAGHNAPLLLRSDGGKAELTRTGPILAVLEEADWRLSPPLSLGPGDVLFLYTDGIEEAHDASGEIYGEERFHASLARHAGADLGARALLDAVLADLDAWRDGHALADDVTCLALRVATPA